MSNHLLKFEAIESRLASYSCPRGTAGRVHALRLRRCFLNISRRQQSTAFATQPFILLAEQSIESTAVTFQENGSAFGAGTVGDGGSLRRDLVNKPGRQLPLRRGLQRVSPSISPRGRIPTGNWKTASFWGWNNVVDPVSQLPSGSQDVLRIEIPDGVTLNGSPNERALHQALRIGTPYDVLAALEKIVRFDGIQGTSALFQSIPPTMFSEILRRLDPRHFVGQYAQLYGELNLHIANKFGMPLDERTGYFQFCTVFLSQIQAIIKARQQTHPLTLPDYKYLLKCARVTGHFEVARAIWMAMTSISISGQTHPVTPDAECFNHYLATLCLTDTMNGLQKRHLRVIPLNLAPRTWKTQPPLLRGHRVGPNKGIKAQVSQIFRQMVDAGISGNEETFSLMMIGLAREGDMDGVASILKRVWGTDVEALLTRDESEIPAVKSYSRDSPFYPSVQTLYAISHAYGINNDIPTALRIVDYISRQYNVAIPITVWNELFQWTLVLSVKRFNDPPEDGTTTGQLPPEAVTNLWTTMTSPPYYVKPTMEMYNRLIASLIYRKCFREAREKMEEGRRLHKRSVLDLSHKLLLYKATSRLDSPVSEKRARDIEYAHLRVLQTREYIRRWIRNLIWRGSKAMKYDDDGWTTHDLPDLLKEWNLFLPKRVKYQVANGEVIFYTNVKEDNVKHQESRRHEWLGWKARMGFKKYVRKGLELRKSRVREPTR